MTSPYDPSNPLGYGTPDYPPPGSSPEQYAPDYGFAEQMRGSRRLSADLDPQPIGQLQSTTIIAAITGIAAMLAGFGVKWGVTDEQKRQISEGILSLVAIGSFVWAWVGRVRATKQVSATKLLTDASKRTLPLLFVLSMCTGCLGNLKQSPMIQLYAAKQAYAESLDQFKAAVQSRMITDPKVLNAFLKLNPEIQSTLLEATIKAKAGDGLGYQFLWEQLQGKLTRFLELQALPKQQPQSLLQERDLWIRPSWLSSLRQHSLCFTLPRQDRRSPTAALSARRNNNSSIFISRTRATELRLLS
jgi:hypothetical protein